MNKRRPQWLNSRQSGVLAHISSLPGNFGIGNLGSGARHFIDTLSDTGFSNWQICPIGPTGYGDSPYQSFSTYAGNPYLLDLEVLLLDGLLSPEDVEPLIRLHDRSVEYGELYALFWPALEKAFERFDPKKPITGFSITWDTFLEQNERWLKPYGLFMGLKQYHGGKPWTEWESVFKNYSSLDAGLLPKEVLEEQQRQFFYQYCFFNQWNQLRDYAHSKDIQIVGDIPVFVAHDSADVWQNPEVFRINTDGSLEVSSGVPPDYFSEFGQYWGNPLYDWEYLKDTNYDWWLDRLEGAFSLFDVVRIDHFRAFSSYWEIPGDATNARIGRWVKGPGIEFFDTLYSKFPDAKLIAEDLGYIDGDVYNLRQTVGLPGMKILQFGYGHDSNNVNLPHYYPKDSVVYTGTHDNDTTRGWLEKLEGEIEQRVYDYYQLEGECSSWPLIRAALFSISNLAILPIQDLLDLGSIARMNTPGTLWGNWQWRFTTEELDSMKEKKGAYLRELHSLSERTGDTRQHLYSTPPELESMAKTTKKVTS